MLSSSFSAHNCIMYSIVIKLILHLKSQGLFNGMLDLVVCENLLSSV